MNTVAPAVVQTAWARAVVDGLVAAGVRDLIVSPGSRSTPLVCAALASDLRCRAVIDERSAAFFALGQSRITGRPSATLCTSGSAAGHAMPAVLEALHAQLPLVLITADRPPALHNCGAPQAMDQTRLFGHSVRAFVDLGLPDPAIAGIRAARRRVAQLVATAAGPIAGPVHLNVPAYKPLEPARATTDAELAFESRVAEVLARPVTAAAAPRSRVPDGQIAELVTACARAERGIIVAGPRHRRDLAARRAVDHLSRATGFPVLVEAASQLRFAGPTPLANACDAFEVLLGSPRFADATNPDLILQLGASPVSSAWRDFLARHATCARLVLCGDQWHDPTSDATTMVFGDVDDAVTRTAHALGESAPPSPWLHRMRRANRDAWQHLEANLAGAEGITEATAMRTIASNLPRGARLMLGNSLCIRNADAYCRGSIADVEVLSQRGLSGIDGLIAGAAGAASVAACPVVLVLGDVSFAHDVGSLAVTGALDGPLVIVVVDNGGGRIFDRLPIARAGVDQAAFRSFWHTPPAADAARTAAGFGLAVHAPEDEQDLARAVELSCREPGATVIHVRVRAGSAGSQLAAATRAFDAAWREDEHD